MITHEDENASGSQAQDQHTPDEEEEEQEERGRVPQASPQSLLARVCRIQRQMEGLQRATASLHGAISRSSRNDHRTEAAGRSTDRRRGEGPSVPVHVSSPARGTGITAAQPPGGQRNETQHRGEGGDHRRAAAARAMRSQRRSMMALMGEAPGDEEMHFGISCDGCGIGPPLRGPVMQCTDCEDFDLCSLCFREADLRGHPRNHNFVPRQPTRDVGGLSGLLTRLAEEGMILEALRLSLEGQNGAGVVVEPEEDPQVRAAEALSRFERKPYKAATVTDECKCCSAADESEECALCLEEYKDGEEILQLPCSHIFHEGCLGPWLVRSLLCPLCKQDLA